MSTQLEKLIDLASVVGDSLSDVKKEGEGFMLIVNHGKTSTTAVVGTSECLASALYTSCKASEELTMIIMAVAASIVDNGIVSKGLVFKGDADDVDETKGFGINPALMGPKGEA
jgi:hypothetical protein